MSPESPSYQYVAYIDEAGDPGLSKVWPRSANGASEWFVIAGVLVPADLESSVSDWVSEMMVAMNSSQMKDLHFKTLTADRKRQVCQILAEKHVRCFVVASNKQNMEGYVNPRAWPRTLMSPPDNWYYCWMTRVLLERMTDYVSKHSRKKTGEIGKIRLEYSERGGLRYTQMQAYYDFINIKSAGGTKDLYLPWGHVDFRTMDRRLLHVYSHRFRPGLKLADITASAFFRAMDARHTSEPDPTYAKILVPRLALEPETKAIAGYGLKLLPSWGKLDRFEVPDSKRAIFRHCGYPKQWWQKVVEPGPV
ncbi:MULTISPECIES: DUF3800 domain-containing protein [Asticcacaulis]|uniref:DUF3800 domain-containing protein n=1 Tax=Asticcacaulis TaxID=76890 RepID=UPI001AE73ED7|nr:MULTISPECIES: DUF3800 domain-containing protein [Asticcacaulis]MBP2159569.1 hypothetical protein [Asticcacaulis solisilvae]MDR6800604.1 hypothetical protein [Asticcacaulis sp. BE141]